METEQGIFGRVDRLLDQLKRAMKIRTVQLLTNVLAGLLLSRCAAPQQLPPPAQQPATEKPSPLIEAVSYRNADAVAALLKTGANANSRNTTYGMPALAIAASNGDDKIVELLLRHGADANGRCNHGNDTPLHQAAWAGHLEIVKLLLRVGAKVGARNDIGMTPLMNAARMGRLSVVRVLLDHRASVAPHVRVKDAPSIKYTALQWAQIQVGYYRRLAPKRDTAAGRQDARNRQKECEQIVKLLREAGAKEQATPR